jgi:hypothetical protein
MDVRWVFDGTRRLKRSGERVLEGGSVRRCSVRREHELDRQREQRPQIFGDLLAGSAVLQHLRWDLEAATEVDQPIACHDRTAALDPEHEVVVRPSGKRLDPDRKPVARGVQVSLATVPL